MRKVSKFGSADIYKKRKGDLTHVEIAGIEKIAGDFVDGELIYSDGTMYPEKVNEWKEQEIMKFYISENGVLYMMTIDDDEYEHHWKVT